MPIVDIQPLGIAAPVDTPKGFAVTPGQDDIDHGSEKPEFGKVMGAAFRQDNTIGALVSREDMSSAEEPGFNPWESIKGTKYEPHWSSFVETRSSRSADAMKRQLDREDEDRKLLEAAPWYQSVPAQLTAGVIDLPTLLPGGTFIRGARGGFSIAKSAMGVGAAAGVSTAAQEAVLQAAEEKRTLLESGVNVGASVILGGLLGSGGAKLLSRAEWNSSVAAIERELVGVPGSSPASAGAAANLPMELEANAIAGRAAGAVAASTVRLNPALRLLQSPSAATREISTQLFENGLYLKKNFDGVASEPAVETLMKEWNGGLASAVRSTNDAFSEYRKTGGPLSHEQFREAVGKAMRRGDDDADPFVSKVAREWRSKVFEPLKQKAIELKLLPEDVSVETAASYFSRMWNRNKLIAQEGRFKEIVRKWVDDSAPRWAEGFDRATIAKAAKLEGADLENYKVTRAAEREERFGDAKAISQFGHDIANNVFNTLTGKAESVVRPEFARVGVRGPLKERSFSIPDHLIEDFLESDIDLVGRRYTRIMGADIEMVSKFGTADMAEQIKKVREDYAKLRQGIDSERQLNKLADAEKADVRDIEALRDLLRGTRQEAPLERNYSRFVRAANHVNYIRSMGEVVLASLTDAIRPAMVHGLGRFMTTIPQLATNMKGIKLSVAEAKLAGNVAERVLGHRLATISEIVDPYSSRGPTEAFLENMTNIASKWNGIRVWTDMAKSVASVMTQNRILEGAANFARTKDKSYLAYLGIDESMAGRIAKQFETHGETVDGVRVANTEEWTDGVAVRTYRAAMNKDVDSIIVQKGVADVPLLANTPTGKALLQFKSFALASHQKILLRGLQEDQSRFLGGLVAMTAMGMFVTYLKALSGNRPETREKALSNPGWWIGEGLDRSGVLSVPMELANTFEKFSGGFNPLKAPFKAFDETGSISQKNQNRSDVGSLLGPTIGMASDMMQVGSIPRRMVQGEEVTKGQMSAAERLLPFNSYNGIRQFIRYVANPPE
jgi:hypothetical protein